MITVKIIEHSINSLGIELISVQTHAPKFLDAEIEKHRMISTNSSSDRAVPAAKMAERPLYVPEDIRKNEPGMQGYEQLSPAKRSKYKYELTVIISRLIDFNKDWADLVHKQTLNRNLLGWSMQDKIMTATKEEWEYFFGLRCDDMADPSIQLLANSIREAINNSRPILLKNGEWHLPYVSSFEKEVHSIESLKMASVARCARVSYLNHDKSDPILGKDIELFDMLKGSGHWSCFEHVATPMIFCDTKELKDLQYIPGSTHLNKDGHIYSGNFRGWSQFRKLLDS